MACPKANTESPNDTLPIYKGLHISVECNVYATTKPNRTINSSLTYFCSHVYRSCTARSEGKNHNAKLPDKDPDIIISLKGDRT